MTHTKTKLTTPATKMPVTKSAAKPVPKPEPNAKPKLKPQVAPGEASNGSAVVHKVRQKLIRDSFTIPKSEYMALEGLKLRASNLARPTKKSELLRAGIAVLASMNDKAFITALGRIPSLKTGRPKAQATGSVRVGAAGA